MRRSVRVRVVALTGAGLLALLALLAGAAPRLLTTRGGARPANTGLERRWVAPVTGWPASLAADAHGAVVVAGRGEVRALEPTGRSRWQAAVPGAGLAPPALARDLVVVAAGDHVVGLDRASGAQRFDVDVAAPDGTAAAVAVVDGVAVVGTEAGTVLAIDAATGALRWSAHHDGAVRTTPVAAGDDAVAIAWHGGDDPQLRVLDLATGTLRWSAPLPRYTSAPISTGDLIAIAEGDGNRNARAVARRARDGAELWATPMPASFESGITPGVSRDQIAVVDHFGTVSVLDRATGALEHRVDLDAPVLHTTVVFTSDALALTTYGGELVVIDRQTGGVTHRSRLDGYPAALAGAGPGPRAELLAALRLTDPGRVESLRLH